MGGKAPTQTNTTTYQMSPEQREIYGEAVPYVREFAANPPQPFPGSGVAGFTPNQILAQELALSAAGGQSDLVGKGGQASDFLLGDVLYPESNPALRAYASNISDEASRNLQRNILPAIGSAEEQAGPGVYSTKGEIARGLAAGESARGATDAITKLFSDAYGTGLGALTRALGLLPQTAALGTLPAQTVGAVGDVQQQMNQAKLTEEVEKWLYSQNLPLSMARELVGLISGVPGGTTTTVGTPPSGPSTASKALGGAASGAALGSMIFPGVGTAAGAGLGALLGFL